MIPASQKDVVLEAPISDPSCHAYDVMVTFFPFFPVLFYFLTTLSKCLVPAREILGEYEEVD